MTTVDAYLAEYPGVKEKVTPEVLKACHYLENHGKVFLYDFGFDNALVLMWRMIDPLGNQPVFEPKSEYVAMLVEI